MNDAGLYLSYSITVFIIVLVSGCILNLLKQHFIFQLAGIAFFFTYFIFNTMGTFLKSPGLSAKELYILSLPTLTGISACLISMVFGFWIFPPIRRKFKA